MSKVMSSQGQIVDFEMMKIMGAINAGNKPQENTKKPLKYYEIPESEFPYIESVSNDELLREQLEQFRLAEVKKEPAIIPEPIKKVEPVPLIIQEPMVEAPIDEIVEEIPIIVESTNIEEAKDIVEHGRRRK